MDIDGFAVDVIFSSGSSIEWYIVVLYFDARPIQGTYTIVLEVRHAFGEVNLTTFNCSICFMSDE